MIERIPAKSLSVSWIASLPKAIRDRLIRRLSPENAEDLEYDWSLRARDNQKPPPGDWRVWLLLAGRGFGKTRTGAEQVRARVAARTARRIALVAPTAADARDVMVEGESGLLAIGPPDDRPEYEPSKHRLTWANGAVATTDPSDLLGQHMEICDRCGGSGEVLADPPPGAGRRAGYVADLV